MFMTHLAKFALLGAVALMTVVACQKEGEDNPNFNAETKEVLTQFSLNVSTNTDTKQQVDVVQVPNGTDAPVFRGLDHASLLSYVQTDNGKILAADATSAKYYDLSELLSNSTGSNYEHRRVLEMSLPLGTNTLLFYGKAKHGGLPSGYALTDKDYYGSMKEYKVEQTAGSANFELCQRLTDETTYKTVCKMISGILTLVMNTNLVGDHHVAISGSDKPAMDVSNTYKYDVAQEEYEAVYWADYALAKYGSTTPAVAATGKSPAFPSLDLSPLEEKLARAYNEMTSIKTNATADGEIRAGSAYAVARTLQDLWTVVNEVRCADPLNKPETVAKYLANRIHLQLSAFFSPEGGVSGNGSAVGALHLLPLYNDDPSVTATIVNGFANAANEWPTNNTPAIQDKINAAKPTVTEMKKPAMVAMHADFGNFPMNLGLPRGAAHYTFDSSSKLFSYVEKFNTSGMDGISSAAGTFDVNSYYYPAELMYFGNSPVRTSKTEHKAADYNNSTIPNWETSSWTPDWSNNFVEASTRSVAMQYNINYGTALLKTQVAYKKAKLKDNNHAIQKEKNGGTLADDLEPDQEIPVDGSGITANPFALTGIIIGGQYANVGWNYLPINAPNTSAKVLGFIYDRDIPSSTTYDASNIPAFTSATSLAYTQPVYTMVLDNYSESGTQDKVYVALEFKNNSGVDFYGNANLIRKDGYFYLIGELDPNKAGLTAITWPTYYKVPPYTTTGDSQKVTRVFIQDFMTSVKFVLGEDSLKYAYLTVPDLRAGSLTLGLSVDVTWSTGLNFEEVVLGGGN